MIDPQKPSEIDVRDLLDEVLGALSPDQADRFRTFIRLLAKSVQADPAQTGLLMDPVFEALNLWVCCQGALISKRADSIFCLDCEGCPALPSMDQRPGLKAYEDAMAEEHGSKRAATIMGIMHLQELLTRSMAPGLEGNTPSDTHPGPSRPEQ